MLVHVCMCVGACENACWCMCVCEYCVGACVYVCWWMCECVCVLVHV